MRTQPWGLLALTAAFGLAVGAAAFHYGRPVASPQAVKDGALAGGWREVAWSLPADPWGQGRAFHCPASACGAELTVHVRPKIGFCDCRYGVDDDEDLDRLGDLDLLDGSRRGTTVGHPISVGHMKGRSRAYALSGLRDTRSALSVAFHDRCDLIVATVAIDHDQPQRFEARALDLLNGRPVLRWLEVTLGL